MSKPATTKSVTPVSPSATPAPVSPLPSPSILKVGTSPSLSGASRLTYCIGCDAQSHILFSITGNSGAGVFSNEWIALADIQQVFDAIPPGKLIRSALLQPLYQKKSINTPAFLLAALMGEGLVAATENQGYYQRADPGRFMAEVSALVDAAVDLKGDIQSGNGKAATRKKSNTDSAPASKDITVAA